MIIVLKSATPVTEIERIKQEISEYNVNIEKIVGKHRVVLALVGETAEIDPRKIQAISPFIEKVSRVEHPFKRASRDFRHGEPSEIFVDTPNGLITFGEHSPVVQIAGPCAVENEEMIVETAKKIKASGAHFLRGGAYKPRTSPYAFQGHGESALELLATARKETGLGIITEVMDADDIEKIANVADILQVGARNMQNFSLLKKIGSQPKPVLLKRGMSATIEEWLMAAEYILAAGNSNVILCERGIRTPDRKYTRNTLDLSVIPVLRTLTHLPIMIDPSHGTGKAEYVGAMAKAAIAAGTDSLMIEVHPNPSKALSDGPQSLTPHSYHELMQEMAVIGQAVGRWPEKFALTPSCSQTSQKFTAVV
jgi:3-deoxy-7-phosphoheptulonate synthase